MPNVEFLPSRRTIEVAPGTVLLEAVRAAGLEIEAPCGGEGVCGKCLVRIVSGEVDADRSGSLLESAAAEGYMLACKTRLLAGPVVVELPTVAGEERGKFVDADELYLIRRDLLPRDWEYDPIALKWLVQTAPARPEDGLSDLDRLTRAIQSDWGRLDVICSLAVMRELATALRADGGRVTATLIREEHKLHVVRVEPGDCTARNFALCVDVGTTTISVLLVNLSTAQILATQTAYNDQMVRGQDIISRINYARRPERLEELRQRVLGTINDLIDRVTRIGEVEPKAIASAIISANTTMNHLLLGLTPEFIRLAPYTPTVLEFPLLAAGEIGLRINPDARVSFSPNNGSYVGGDITAGLLCTDLADEMEEVCLFIDIGTNGELVIGNRDFLISCACSAGPAFEGSGVACGMRASLGAIEKVSVEGETGIARYATISAAQPRGICGSGMIDLLASLFQTGWIDPSGKFNRARRSPAIEIEGKNARYILATAAESATGKTIFIDETDIANIIRAKAAIYSACALVLKQVELDFDDLARIYIAGSFGRFLDIEKAIILGLAPDVPRERFRYIGNASLMGSYMAAVSRDHRQRQLALSRRMAYIDLSTTPGYMEEYMAALFLPHTEMARFPSVATCVKS